MKRVWKCRRKGLGSVVVRRMPRCHRWSASATAAGLPEGRKSGLRSISYFFMVGLRYRGNSLGLSSVSNLRTGCIPSVNRMIENLSDWDIDTSDSEGGGYGGRDSPKASPRDDKVANGGARHIYFANAPGNYNDRVVVGHRDSARIGLGNWYAVLSYDASVRLCLHSWARSCMRAPPFLENECSLLRDVLEEKLTRKDHFELVGEGAYVKSKKTIGKIRVQVRNVKMGTKQPTGFTFTSLKSSSTVKLETFQQRIIFLFVEIEKFAQRGCIGNVTGICLPDGFGDDLIIEVHDSKGKYCGHALVQVADISDESVLDLEIHTQSSGIMNVHCWLPGMAIYVSTIVKCILAFRSFRYLSYVMDISTATVDYLDLVHDILLPVVIKDKSPFSGRNVFGPATRLAAPALDPALKLYKWLHDILSPRLLREKDLLILVYYLNPMQWSRQLYINFPCLICRLRNILLKSEEELPRNDHSELVGEGIYVTSKKTIGKVKVQVRKVKMGTEQPTGCMFTSLKSSSTVKLETFQQRTIFLFVEIEKFTRRGCIGNVTGICLPDGFGDDLIIEVHDSKGKYCGHALVQVADISDESVLDLEMHTQSSGIMNVHCWLPGMAIYVSTIVKCILAFRSFRYLSYVIDISTATVDYLDLVHDILLPVVIKDKSPFSGRRLAAPALDPALKLYKWLHDILSPRLLREKGNWYAVLSYDASVLLSLHSWARSCMGAPPFLENECSLLRDVLGIIFLFVEIEKFARRGCIGNATGICLPDGFGDDLIIEVHDSKGKYCGHARVQVADISDESVLDLDLIFDAYTKLSGLGNWYAVLSYDASVRLCLHSWARSCMGAPPFLENECSLLRDVLGIIFMFVEIEKFTRRGCIGNVTGICLPDGFGDDLIIEVHDSKGKYCGHARVQVADISDESVLDLDLFLLFLKQIRSKKKLGKIQLYINYSTTADESSCKCIYICSRNYSLRLCFGDCDERPTVSAKKLVATWFVEMMNVKDVFGTATGLAAPALDPLAVASKAYFGFFCTKERYLKGVIFMFVEIEKFTRRGCIGNVTGICLPDGFGDDLIIEVHDSKGKYCGHARVQVADISDESVLDLDLIFETIAYDYVLETALRGQQFQQRNLLLLHGLAAPALDQALKLYKWLHDILSPEVLSVGLSWIVSAVDDFVVASLAWMVFHVKISVKRLPPLLKGLEGSDLKVRLESIESVTKILEEANKPILPAGTGDLFGALKGRPHDSNNIFFIIATLSTIGALTTTMDCQLRSQARYSRIVVGILSDALKSLGDTKSICLSLPYIILSNAEIGIEGCRDLFKWLSRRQLAGLVSSLDEIKLLKPTASAITDKLAGGCKAAEACFNEILRGFMDKKRKRLKPYGALQDNYESGRSVSSRSSGKQIFVHRVLFYIANAKPSFGRYHPFRGVVDGMLYFIYCWHYVLFILLDLNRGHSLVKIMQVIAIATTEGFKNEAKNMLVASGDIEHTYVPTQHLIRLV
ncbi:hypothetical protein SASPL_157970 [Salvia splendens]|uniref:Uncharacterized protein n=1 Tax=Salvia splendens TaxID=180675 RepID=A0A8X8YTB5_SALSN|nr:hypothetical protein SASPL_157970 [Salvia splendens]